MNPDILITAGAALLYLTFGIFHTRYLKACWHEFGQVADSSPLIHLVSVIAWAGLFLVLITWRALEPLMEDRRSDWE